LKLVALPVNECLVVNPVAFTPKGGCPLKLADLYQSVYTLTSSIHPQGWVPIETYATELHDARHMGDEVAFTPKGGCPLKLVATWKPTAHQVAL